MNNPPVYQELKQHYLTGNLKAFRELYATTKEEERTEQTHLLAIKVFKEANEWDLLFLEIGSLKASSNPEYTIKAGLYEAFYSFLLKVQSRKFAEATIAQCEKVSRDFPGSELDFFAQRISLSAQMGLTTLGLADAAKKQALIESALTCVEHYLQINSEDAITLLDAVVGHCIGLPMPQPKLALQILERFGKMPDENTSLALIDTSFCLHFAKAKLMLEHFDRDHLPSPADLPTSLILVKDKLNQTGYLPGESFLMGMFGSHLLKLEYLEGIEYLEQTLQQLWDLGYEQVAHSNKEQIGNWIEQRGFIQEAEQFKDRYRHISNTTPAFFEQNLEKLRQAHQLFSEGSYGASQQFLQDSNLGQESETFKVSFVSMLVNSAAKLQSERQSLIDLLDLQINELKPVQNSSLLAQLHSFKTQLALNPYSESYDITIHLFDKLGFADEAVTYLTNQAYDLALYRNKKGEQPLINDELIQAFRRVDDYLKGNDLIVDRYSLEATLFQRWGIVLMLAEQTEKAAECFQTAGDLFLAANYPFNYAINTHHLAGANIMIGRNQGKLEHYDLAVEHLKNGIGILENSKVIDFFWRLNFNMAVALSEPLKYGLVADPEKKQLRFEAADQFYNKTLEVFTLILKKNALKDRPQRLLAYGQLNQAIRQLIFSGFYCYFFEQHWGKCVSWLEKVRAKTLLTAIADKIEPGHDILHHDLLLQETSLKNKLLETPFILEQREINDELEHLYAKMLEDDALIDYAGKKQVLLPDLNEVRNGLRQEEALSGRKIVFIYFYSYGDEIYVFGIRSDTEVTLFEKIQSVSVPDLKRELAHSYQLYIQSYHLLKPSEQFWVKYSPLIAPVKKWTAAGEILCIIPYGFLHDLPYHALQLDGKPLIARNPVFYNPSLSSWEYLRQKKGNLSLLEKPAVFSNPDENRSLELTQQEADTLGNLLTIEPFKGAEVNKSHFLESLSDCSLLHFAGHGFYEREEGLQSGLALFSGETVTVYEIMNQYTNADLIVLSACDTGLHRNHPGEERAGLVTALLSAGAKSVIASLWRVTDADAQHFFKVFYPKLKNGMPKVIALQETMLELMENDDRKQFYHWGAFALQGYWG